MSSNPRLGRGLAALLGDAPVPEAASAPQSSSPLAISIDSLEPGPFQPRRNMAPEAMTELVDSIRARGILQPLLARRHPGEAGRYQIIAGERRWRAAQQAGLHEVPVLVRDLEDRDAHGRIAGGKPPAPGSEPHRRSRRL